MGQTMQHVAPAHDPEGAETRVMHALVDFTGKDVLQVGCGDGRMTWRFADRTRSVLGIDPKTEMIAAARAACPAALRQRVTFQTGDITTAALPSARFDVAVLSWSL
jgi:ubiquinone/menaquinone biosynthesis C-methylase UbiE